MMPHPNHVAGSRQSGRGRRVSGSLSVGAVDITHDSRLDSDRNLTFKPYNRARESLDELGDVRIVEEILRRLSFLFVPKLHNCAA